MSNAHDRRAPGTARIPFDAMVEVGGALGPSFEAQALNLSEEGMSFRTAYLPEVGQPVMCRFDPGEGQGQGTGVVAAGEVLWKDDMGEGGEFGIRFTNLDPQSTTALQRILGTDAKSPIEQGRKVRLHIDGLASPMRARIKDQAASGVTAYSELGFLQMGRPLELEDAVSGNRRPALIDRVAVEIDAGSQIPQLIVSLRYDDTDGRALAAANEVPVEEGDESSEGDDGAKAPEDDFSPEMNIRAEAAEAPAPARAVEAKPAPEEEGNKLKAAFTRNAAKVTPAIVAWATRAKVAAALLAARARRGSSSGDDVEIPMRRTTAPAPGGGLHTEGRKVVRGSVPDDRFEDELLPATSRFKVTKKKAAIAGAIGITLLLVFVAMRKPAAAPQLASTPPGDTTTTGAATAAPATAAAKPLAPPSDPLAAAAAAMASKGGKATPFTNGPVGSRPTVIKIKMDGAIDGIQGAPQPTGFTIVIPNRKSIEPIGSLADRDPRISGIQVANEAGGAEFSVAFKDGVPNYLVRAHGDTLELVLAKGSSHGEKSEAKAKKKTKKH